MVGRRNIVRPGVRQAEIFDLIARHGEASVESLATKFQTSQETIRRDLSLLADAGRVQKVHGGARRVLNREEGAFDARMRRNVLAKTVIAEKLMQLVAPRQTIFMDTGSTTLICAEAIAKIKNLKVITNSAKIASVFGAGKGRAEVYLLGGQYKEDNAQTVGPVTIAEIGRYHADHAIITVGSLNAAGIFDYSYDESQVARAMVSAAAKLTVVADHSKLGQNATFRVCRLDDVNHLVVDKLPAGAVGDVVTSSRIEVL